MGKLLRFPVRPGLARCAAPPELPTLRGFVLQAYPGAVVMLAPGLEYWLSPKQARDIAGDLARMADLADRGVR